MGKSKSRASRLLRFVSSLSEEEVRSELFLSYQQMERCISVLKGEKVKPVKMLDNGFNSGLELFYRCKKVYEELTSPEGYTVSMTCFLGSPYSETGTWINEPLRRKCADKYSVGDWVWYMFGDRMQYGFVTKVLNHVDGMAVYETSLGHSTIEIETFRTQEELFEYLKSTVNEDDTINKAR